MFIAEENPLYARVMITGGLKKNYAEEISLPSATSDGKLYFHQLRVKDIIRWKLSNLRCVENKDLSTSIPASEKSHTLTQEKIKETNEDDNLRLSRTDSEVDSSSDDSGPHSTSTSDENSESEGNHDSGFLSPYEKMIIQNKRKLDKKKKEIMGEFLLPSTKAQEKSSKSPRKISPRKVSSVRKKPSKTKPSQKKHSSPKSKGNSSSPKKNKTAIARAKSNMEELQVDEYGSTQSTEDVTKGNKMCKADKVSESSKRPMQGRPSQSPSKKTKFYEYVEVSDSDERGFQPHVIEGKRVRKPNKLYMEK